MSKLRATKFDTYGQPNHPLLATNKPRYKQVIFNYLQFASNHDAVVYCNRVQVTNLQVLSPTELCSWLNFEDKTTGRMGCVKTKWDPKGYYYGSRYPSSFDLVMFIPVGDTNEHT